MTKRKSRKKSYGQPRPIAIVLLVLLLTGAALAGFLLTRDDSQAETEQYASTAQEGQTATQVVATFNGSLESDDDLRSYIAAIDTSTTPTIIEPESVDWATQQLIPVDFYLPSGQQPQTLSYVDASSPLSLQVLKAPEGCAFVSAQRHYHAFAVVDSGVVVSQPDINIVYVDNPDKCTGS